MIEAGKLTERVTLFRPSVTRNGVGEELLGYRRVAVVAAGRSNPLMRDFARMAGEATGTECRFTIRYRGGLDTGWQIEHRCKRFAVTAIEEIGRHEGLVLVARSIQ